MTRKTWSEVEISAYLDGELDPEAHAAFEVALAQDSELRRRVDAVKLTIALIRAVPLREPSRNYLLTPSMVAETAVEPVKRRRMPLFVMRLATSLTAVVFVISLGLNLLNVANPAMITQQMAEPERTMLSVTDDVASEERWNKATAPMPQPVAPQSVEESETLSPQQEMALAPAPLAEPPSDMVEGLGVGGGAGPAEDAPVEADEAQEMQMFKAEEGILENGASPPGVPGDEVSGNSVQEESFEAPVLEEQKATNPDLSLIHISEPTRPY